METANCWRATLAAISAWQSMSENIHELIEEQSIVVANGLIHGGQDSH